MPAPLDVDREAVKAHAITHGGVREAARHFGLSENTVMAWSVRDKWFAKPELPELPATMKPVASGARKPSEAAQIALQIMGEKTKLGLAKGILKGARHVGKLKGDSVLAQSQQVAHLTKAAGTIHGWQEGASGPAALIQLNILSGEGPSVSG